ncbi:MAG TPA: 16S rRNA (guanine(527)-N(7))-methyltransferase RsmG [Saprospiraceae bacterium]|nr:16S rRNA (guanine(527)-N(7))-methyltransferase RsmG [Saprospiraceae bacterium]
MELIRKYFPGLTSRQLEQLTALETLYREWNEKINVISRQDIQHLYEHHVLHSLAIAKYNPFTQGMQVLDAGTGGGFPGIPLAILFPQVHFTLLDSIAKKIHVVNEIIKAISLQNAIGVQSRLEDFSGPCDIMTSRAVSTLSQLTNWSKKSGTKRWVILKGGTPQEFRKELPPKFSVKSIPVNEYFEEEYFKGKYLVDITLHP